MPIGEPETHPYLALGQVPNATRLILGSFPVYECTNVDNEFKQNRRIQNNSIRFFYGSGHSKLWDLYSSFIDETIVQPYIPDILMESLIRNEVAMSDLIQGCDRVGYSALDNDLRGRIWNRQGIVELINNGVNKILCTSKGVLDNLKSRVLCCAHNPVASFNEFESAQLHNRILHEVNGNADISKLTAAVFIMNNNEQTVTALAIPSPGSPQRRLRNFGFEEGGWQQYAENYFSAAFNWLMQ